MPDVPYGYRAGALAYRPAVAVRPLTVRTFVPPRISPQMVSRILAGLEVPAGAAVTTVAPLIVLDQAIKTDRIIRERLAREAAAAQDFYKVGDAFDPGSRGWEVVSAAHAPFNPALWQCSASEGQYVYPGYATSATACGNAGTIYGGIAPGDLVGPLTAWTPYMDKLTVWQPSATYNPTLQRITGLRARSWVYTGVEPVNPYRPLWMPVPWTGVRTRPLVETDHASAPSAARPRSLPRPTAYAASGNKPYSFRGRQKPSKKEKQKKGKTKTEKAAWTIVEFLNEATEFLDVLDAAWKSLDENCKQPFADQLKPTRRWDPEHVVKKGKNKGRKGGWVQDKPPEWKKQTVQANAVFQCLANMDLDSFVFNLAWSQIVEDRVYAKLGVKLPGRYGGAIGANRIINKAYGKDVAEKLKAAEGEARKVFEKLFGVTTQ